MMSAWRLGAFFSLRTWKCQRPKKKHYDAVQRHAETNGYKCGELFQVYKNGEMATALTDIAYEEEEPMLFCRESNVCGA